MVYRNGLCGALGMDCVVHKEWTVWSIGIDRVVHKEWTVRLMWNGLYGP